MSANITGSRRTARRLYRHTTTRIMVLESHRIMFLPLPKSGCTSLLWMLAGLAGLDGSRFRGSTTAEVSHAMTIHDTSRWDDRHRWAEHDADEQERIQADESWLRFTVVRDPAPRLWSAWQSKLLLKEPRFVERFGDADWFPHEVAGLDAAVAAFRAFVRALDVPADDAPHDAHWGPQSGLIERFRLNYVGRAELPDATVERIDAHLGDGERLDPGVPRENSAPVPYHPSVYDEETAAILNRVYARDFETFGYPPLSPVGHGESAAWRATAETAAGFAAQLAERHLRIGTLLAELERSQAAEQRLAVRLQTEADRVRAIEESRSWRVTRPLRAIRRG
ncbi:sulfotransferase family protein [Nocardioidaceae bacterium SCSIO 66511]|nr:sulfotransferase family protein [Nocardioidaceae bacterium SCSIO 66511]